MTKTPEEKKLHYSRYGWTVDETNLATLPASAPQAAKDLVRWLTLEGRRKALVEWIRCCSEDGKIHGKYWPIGAWTHRMSHSNPNSANIAAPFQGDPKTPVEEIKAKYDASMRDLWKASEGAWLVGTDAEGIQLRLLAHYMKSQPYVDAICSGRKEDKTDIHNMNMKALGPVCRDRDTAKTFIYAFLLGAANAKVAEILNCNSKQAAEAINNFLVSLPGLKKLKEWTIPNDARRG